MSRHFRIHPSIGIARVGNSPDEHFIGPEQPERPANWVNDRFAPFRDSDGRIKRQAARFHLFEYSEDAEGRLSEPREITVGGEIAAIEWRVHIINKKASFFTFNGQSGADDVYLSRSQTPASATEKQPQAKAKDQGEKKQKEDPGRPNRRNAEVPDGDREHLLDIDPGEKLISTARPDAVVLANPNRNVTFIPDLGELRLIDGCLLVLGGHGISGSTQDPAVVIDEYANNDTWFDDVGDGPVKARIVFRDGTVADADPAWVLVGPPDFAPGIGNAVTLYDTLWDLAVRELPAPSKNTLFVNGPLRRLTEQKKAWVESAGKSLAGYKPSFRREIYPVLSRAFLARWVFDPGEMDRNSFHVAMLNWNRLADVGDGAKPLRISVFERIRKPEGDEIDWHSMPRGLGDDYDHLDDERPKPTGLLSLTRIQYAMLEQWAMGNFDETEWTGSEPPIPEPEQLTPDGLDKAALENGVGGPFYPGIEVSWLVRRPELYSEPFRFKIPGTPEPETKEAPLVLGALTFGPGFFSQQMAQPWQADFYDCHKEQRESTDNRLHYYMWWTAQRPDDVYPPGSSRETLQQPWVRRFTPEGMLFDDFEADNERFRQMQQNWHNKAKLRFVIRTPQNRFEEEP